MALHWSDTSLNSVCICIAVGGTFLNSTCQNTTEDTDDGHSDMGQFV